MNIDHDYARKKLEQLLRDLPAYTGDELWRQMSRIAGGATGADHAEELARDLEAERHHRQAVARSEHALAAHVEQIREAFMPGADGTDGGRLLAIGYVLNQSPTTSLTRRQAPAGWHLVPGLDECEHQALARFDETTRDDGTYDIDKAMIWRLARKGSIHHLSAGRYELTEAGRAMLAAAPKPGGIE